MCFAKANQRAKDGAYYDESWAGGWKTKQGFEWYWKQTCSNKKQANKILSDDQRPREQNLVWTLTTLILKKNQEGGNCKIKCHK